MFLKVVVVVLQFLGEVTYELMVVSLYFDVAPGGNNMFDVSLGKAPLFWKEGISGIVVWMLSQNSRVLSPSLNNLELDDKYLGLEFPDDLEIFSCSMKERELAPQLSVSQIGGLTCFRMNLSIGLFGIFTSDALVSLMMFMYLRT